MPLGGLLGDSWGSHSCLLGLLGSSSGFLGKLWLPPGDLLWASCALPEPAGTGSSVPPDDSWLHQSAPRVPPGCIRVHHECLLGACSVFAKSAEDCRPPKTFLWFWLCLAGLVLPALPGGDLAAHALLAAVMLAPALLSRALLAPSLLTSALLALLAPACCLMPCWPLPCWLLLCWRLPCWPLLAGSWLLSPPLLAPAMLPVPSWSLPY